MLTNKVGTEALGSDWAILSGSLENSGSSEIKEMGFCYTTVDKDPVKDVDKFVPVKDKKDFTYKLTGLVDISTKPVNLYVKSFLSFTGTNLSTSFTGSLSTVV